MILQVHINDADLAGVLEKYGHKTEMVEVHEWRKTYHNRDELITAMRLHVVEGNKKIPAKDFAEKLLISKFFNN